MNAPVLLAETPRAGDLGHRFLAPPGVPVTESEIAAYVRAGEGDLVIGENFIAISRQASQHVGDGVRVGREILVLAGIDLALTTGRSLARIVASLRHCLNALADLVCDGIDWKCVSQVDVVVRRRELEQWLTELDAGPISNSDWRSGPRLLVEGRHESAGPGFLASNKAAPHISAALILVIAVFAAVVGMLLGGVIVGAWCSSGTPTVEHADLDGATQVTEPRETASPEKVPPETFEEPTPRQPAESDGVDQLIVTATTTDDPDAVVFLLSALPRDRTVSSRARNSVIEGCSALVESRRFDEALRISDAAWALGRRFLQEPMDNARLLEVRRKAREGAAALDSKDKSLYEYIQQSSGLPAVKAARQYLVSAPRQYMSRSVTRWLEWSQQPLTIQVTDVDVPWQGPFHLELDAGVWKIGYSGVSPAEISDSHPLTFATSYLGVAGQELPSILSISVEHTNVSFGQPPTRLEGQLQLKEDSNADSRVSLRSTRPPHGSAQIACRVDRPELPEWSRDSQ